MSAITNDLLTAPQALAELGGVLGRTAFYDALQRGQLPATRVGRRWVLSRSALRRHFSIDPVPAPATPRSGADELMSSAAG